MFYLKHLALGELITSERHLALPNCCMLYIFFHILFSYTLPQPRSLAMVKRLDVDILHHGPLKHDRLPVLHTAFSSVSNFWIHRTRANRHHHTRKQYLETKSHWHSPGQKICLLLHTEKGELHFGYHKEPRIGADVLGPGNFKFKPGYWTSWARKPKKEEIVVLSVVQDEGLYRNICSAILDAEKCPYLRTTPLWLRGVFAALNLLPTARKWLVEWILYIQLQGIYLQTRVLGVPWWYQCAELVAVDAPL